MALNPVRQEVFLFNLWCLFPVLVWLSITFLRVIILFKLLYDADFSIRSNETHFQPTYKPWEGLKKEDLAVKGKDSRVYLPLPTVVRNIKTKANPCSEHQLVRVSMRESEMSKMDQSYKNFISISSHSDVFLRNVTSACHKWQRA